MVNPPNSQQKYPLVSAIMPTAGRAQFVCLAVDYFLRQDYPNKELIIGYDHQGDLPIKMPAHTNIRLIHTRAQSLGEKRGILAKAAKGSIIIHFDDDDWYYSSRISYQVEPIIAGKADMTALTEPLMFDLHTKVMWKASSRLYQQILYKNVVAGTLTYRKSYIDQGATYPHINLREDVGLLDNIATKGGQLLALAAHDKYVYMRHGNNTWAFVAGEWINTNEWTTVDYFDAFKADIKNYINISSPHFNNSKVSCIMPTADRPEFVIKSIEYFKNQDYNNKELVIVDDGRESIGHLIPLNDPEVRYIKLSRKRLLGAKRNLACQLARGEIIIHWDDDDWVSNRWISLQVASLKKHNADITGLSELFFWEPEADAWTYQYLGNRKPWVHGGTLCYTKKLWARNQFPEVQIGEDIRFLWSGVQKKVVPHEFKSHYVALIHKNNTSSKKYKDAQWEREDLTRIKSFMHEDFMSYL